MTRALVQERAGDPKEPYGPSSKAHYADPGYQHDGKKRYPLDSYERCRAAWSYINQKDNAAKYTPQQRARIKSRIKAAGKRYGIDFAADDRARMLDALSLEYRRAFIESNYERDPKGSTTGGQFTAKPAEPVREKPKPKTRRPQGGKAQPRQSVGTGAMSYDPRTGRGTGYGLADGDARVKRLQQALNRLGVRDSRGRRLDVDGKLGPLTTQAVKAAQRRLGLKADGVVTAGLLDKIAEAKSLPAKRKPKRCVCRSVECLSDECRDEGEYRRVVEPMATRAFEFTPEATDGRTLEGYVAVFNQVARISDRNGDFDEEIHRGAFDRSLEKRGFPVMQFEHGKDPRVGMLPIGVYDVFEPDQRGYRVRGTLLDDPLIDPIAKAIKARAIKGMSWRMVVPDTGQRWSRRSRYERGVDKRDITDADVPEAGPVVFPAYTGTAVSVRSVFDGISDDELAVLASELRAHLGLATDLTGQPDARSAGGGDRDGHPGGEPPHNPISPLARQRALRMRGVLT